MLKALLACLLAAAGLYYFKFGPYSSSRKRAAGEPIYDPMNVFCGSHNCYEVLGLDPSGDISGDAKAAVKKAYRTTSKKYHPDKNKDANATALFRAVSKANDVLSNEVTKKQFDEYLAHPSMSLYFKISGSYFYNETLKLDKKYVITILLLLFSVVSYRMQKDRHEDFMVKLREVFHLDIADYRQLQLMQLDKYCKECEKSVQDEMKELRQCQDDYHKYPHDELKRLQDKLKRFQDKEKKTKANKQELEVSSDEPTSALEEGIDRMEEDIRNMEEIIERKKNEIMDMMGQISESKGLYQMYKKKTALELIKDFASSRWSKDGHLSRALNDVIGAITNDILAKCGHASDSSADIDSNSKIDADKSTDLKDTSKLGGNKGIDKEEEMKPLLPSGFHDAAEEVISSLKLQGGYRNPGFKDLFIVKVIIFPYTFFNWVKQFYLFNLSSSISDEKKAEMVIGEDLWAQFDEKKRDRMIKEKVWSSFSKPIHDIIEDLEHEEFDFLASAQDGEDSSDISGEKVINKKALKRLNKKKKQ